MTLTRSEQLEALSSLCEQTNAPELLAHIAKNLRYDRHLQRIWIHVPNDPDETFPDDADLNRGPLTLAVWIMVLFELADALPPWEET